MKKAIIITVALILSSSLMANPNIEKNPKELKEIVQTSNAKELFISKCASCHSLSRPTDMSKVVAPAIMGVMRHVKMSYRDKDKAILFIKDYILNPSLDKAICKPQKIKRFGLMPSQKGVVSEKELDIILPWVYDNFPPKGFRGMGQGRGMIKMH